jgi:cytochrome c5
VRGYKGMPPLGACMDCTEREFEALIRFMAGLEAG